MQSLGPFEVERELGRGGSAVVFAARRGDERVALKVAHDPSPDDARRFVEEAKKLSRVSHPAVVRVLDAGELPDGRAYLAMPLLEGETLAARVARGPLERDVALDLFAAVSSGVEALHEAGLLHRDIKPENVFLAGDPPKPVLLDLGIAKDAEALPSHTTQQGVIRGTPATMAPERFFGQPASIASDVYELGLLLYVMLVGRAPWSDDADVADRLGAAPPHEVDPSIPRALSDVVMRALSTRATRRPASTRELRDAVLDTGRESSPRRVTAAIERTETSEPAITGRGSPRETPLSSALPPSRRAPRSNASTVGVAVLGTLLGGGIVYAATRSPGSRSVASTSSVPVEASAPLVQLMEVASASASPPVATDPTAEAKPTAAVSSSPPVPSAQAQRSAPKAQAEAVVTDAGTLSWCQRRLELRCKEDPDNCAAFRQILPKHYSDALSYATPKQVNAICKSDYDSDMKREEQEKQDKAERAARRKDAESAPAHKERSPDPPTDDVPHEYIYIPP